MDNDKVQHLRNEPQIRFNNFKESYSEFTLGDIATFSKGKGISKGDICEDGVLECIRYGELYTKYGENITKVYSRTSVSDVVLSEKYDIITPSSGETAIDLATASCVSKKGVALGGDINIIRTKQHGLYLSYYLNSNKKYDFAKLGQGNSVVHIYNSHLKELRLRLPNFDEQHKVASFISTLDQKIELLDSKLENLKLFKKGLTQTLLDNLKDCKSMKLSDIASIVTGKLDANAMIVDGEYRFYTCAKDYYRIDKYAFEGESLLISGNGANVGYIHYYNGKFNAYQRTYVLQDFSENINYIKTFLDLMLAKRIASERFEGNTPYIVKSTLADFKIPVPNKSIQKSIAINVSNLNTKINLFKEKLETLKQFKKGLLQQMFI